MEIGLHILSQTAYLIESRGSYNMNSKKEHKNKKNKRNEMKKWNNKCRK